MRVDFPAPFSPSSAWISPRFSSKSIALFATSEPKRLVIPRSSRAGAAPGMVRCAPLLHRVGDLDVAVLDVLLGLLDLGLELGSLRRDLADAHAAGLQVEDRVRAALELVGLGVLDRVEHRDVDLLHRAGEDVGAEVALVGVDTDADD